MSHTFVILARNEAQRIGDCIESIRRFDASPILVVDNESTDETAAIALDRGATRVVSFDVEPFAFDVARNFAHANVETRYAFHIDADERLEGSVGDNLTCDIHVVRIKLHSVPKWWCPAAIYQLGARYVNVNKVAWHGSIHEMPRSRNGSIATISHLPVATLDHARSTIREDNVLRNRAMLDVAFGECLSRGEYVEAGLRALQVGELYLSEDPAYAIQYLTLAVSWLPTTTPHHWQALIQRSIAHVERAEIDAALQDARVARMLNPRFRGAFLVAAHVYHTIGANEAAVTMYRKALAIKEPFYLGIPHSEEEEIRAIESRIAACGG